MRYEKTIKITTKMTELINKHLHEEPTCAEECLGEDIAIVNTVSFENGFEMDIKCCGVQYDEASESNTAWTEAVLFQNGRELCCSEPSDEYVGEWSLEYEGDEYIVVVEAEDVLTNDTLERKLDFRNSKVSYHVCGPINNEFAFVIGDREFKDLEGDFYAIQMVYRKTDDTWIAEIWFDDDPICLRVGESPKTITDRYITEEEIEELKEQFINDDLRNGEMK